MLLTLRNIRITYGAAPLLDGLDLTLAAGERVALVGRNGSGKSTLLRVIAGEITADEGVIERPQGLRVASLAQEVPTAVAGTVYQVVSAGLGAPGVALAEYHALSEQLAQGLDVSAAMGRAQDAVERAGAWLLGQRVDAVLARLGLPTDAAFAQLSGGQKRRVLLGAALVSEPDLLLLDEPTNHLDIAAIAALEDLVLGFAGAVLLITHDRTFLRRVATRIVALDRGRISSWPGDYDRFLVSQARALEQEQRGNALFDQRLAQEEVWIRTGIKARRTRNEGRVRALEALRRERRARRERDGTARIALQTAQRSGRQVVVAEDLSYRWPGTDAALVRDFSTVIQRGDKVGIIGPNGCGKTTLIQLLLGQLKPEAGTVTLGTTLEVAHFDQQREVLNLEASVQENVAPGSETVEINGERRHVIGYLQDFLFSPQRARTPVKALSGGERSRLLLARLFTRPANLLVMDEPTNDLDVETLELLEGLLVNYTGTLLLVSHDRAFLDNVVTSTLVFEGEGRIGEYVGGYQDWLRQRPAAPVPARPIEAPAVGTSGNAAPVAAPANGPAKAAAEPSARPLARAPQPALTQAQRRELGQLPRQIETLEKQLAELHAAFARPEHYARPASELAEDQRRVAQLQARLDETMARWEALEQAANSGA